MKWADIKNKNTDELQELLVQQKAELQNLNFQAHARQLKQVHKISSAKKITARLIILLEQRKRENKNK
ncbi:MAG: 50S ribosomal protein L29 [bacterium]